MRRLAIALLLTAAVASAQAPSFDSSGNKLLNGSDYFRHVLYVSSGDAAGDVGNAYVLYGNITFDGNGNYTVTCQEFDTSNLVQQNYSTTGTYTISASGYGYLANPISTGDFIYGLVANGIFVGSSTENKNDYSDLFIAAPAASSATATSVFQGNYAAGYFSPYPGTNGVLYTVDASFQLNPNGSGNLGTVNMSGYAGEGGSSVLTQSASNVKYVISNGAANMMFPSSSTADFLAGDEYAYISPDGNFIFGGSPTGFDIFAGVKTGSSNNVFGGLYYTAGVEENASTLSADSYADLNTYYGAFSAGNGAVIGHERFTSALSKTTVNFTYTDTYSAGSGGTYTDSATSMQYTIGDGGLIRIGSGIGPILGLSVALQAPGLSGSGVFLNPVGIVNAASYAPFTAGVAPGEFITLFGTNLAPSDQTAAAFPFPTTLNGVQVLINGVAAPIYYVTPTQISAIVPYEIVPSATTLSVAQIQVKNAGVTSNGVTLFVWETAPGVFTQPQDGLGIAAALHGAGSTLITADSPAQIGETVEVYLAGLGDVSPPVGDGAAAPSSPLSEASNTIAVDVAGVAASVTYAGLAPGFAGLYQINFVVPSGLTAGNNSLDIAGLNSSYTAEAVLPIAGTSATAAAQRRLVRPVMPRIFVPPALLSTAR